MARGHIEIRHFAKNLGEKCQEQPQPQPGRTVCLFLLLILQKKLVSGIFLSSKYNTYLDSVNIFRMTIDAYIYAENIQPETRRNGARYVILKYTDISKVLQWIHERGGGMRMK